jgi:hypothetical protein
VRRSLALRLVTALWALWFGVVLIEPAAVHAYLGHGEHASHTAHSAHPAGMAHGHMDMAPGHDMGSHHSGAPDHDGAKCIGACCCAPAVTVSLAKIAELPAAVTVAVRAFIPNGEFAEPIVAPAYSHPFANGPPAANAS